VLVIKNIVFPISITICNTKIRIVFNIEKTTNLQLIHISIFLSTENINKRGMETVIQNIKIIKANLSSLCVSSNAYLLFFAKSNNLFVINEYIVNNKAVKEINKERKLDL